LKFISKFGVLFAGIVLVCVGAWFGAGLGSQGYNSSATYSGSYNPLKGVDMAVAMSTAHQPILFISSGPGSFVAVLFGVALIGGWIGFRTTRRRRERVAR
jgi:hypothetical protein